MADDDNAASRRARARRSTASPIRAGSKPPDGLRVRLPLPGLVVASPVADTLAPFADLIANEVNVKSVTFTGELTGYRNAGQCSTLQGGGEGLR